MPADPVLLIAARVQRGDRVQVGGRWLEVTAVRPGRYASGGPAVTLVFTAAPSLRVHAAQQMSIRPKLR